jgi:hypothetical protein
MTSRPELMPQPSAPSPSRAGKSERYFKKHGCRLKLNATPKAIPALNKAGEKGHRPIPRGLLRALPMFLRRCAIFVTWLRRRRKIHIVTFLVQ